MKREIAQHLQLPGDFALGTIKITTIGNREACAENFKGILEYSQEKIIVQGKACQVEIYGKELVIVYYTCDEMKIEGCIEDIIYVEV